MTLSLFVYGSLRPGQCNYHQLSEAVLSARTVKWPGHLRLRPEGYPALVLPPDLPVHLGTPYDWTIPVGPPDGAPNGPVAGEILRLRDSPGLRRRLDDFEGFTPVLKDYLRVAVGWRGEWVWTYTAPPDPPDWPIIQHWPLEEGPLTPWELRRADRE